MSTKTIDATVLRNNLSDAIESVNNGQTLLVRKRGKLRVAIVDLDRFEDMLAAQDPEYLKAIAEARAEYSKGDVLSPQDAFGEV